jgi:hypothetical protein
MGEDNSLGLRIRRTRELLRKTYYLLFGPVEWYCVEASQLFPVVSGRALETCPWEP